jgi:hypothetical protein
LPPPVGSPCHKDTVSPGASHIAGINQQTTPCAADDRAQGPSMTWLRPVDRTSGTLTLKAGTLSCLAHHGTPLSERCPTTTALERTIVPGLSTSVSGNLLSPWGSSQRDPQRPAAVRVPDRGRGALGPASRVFCDTASPARRQSRGRRPGSRPGDSCFRYLGGESESPIIGVGICVPCAVTLTPSARYPEAQTAPSRPALQIYRSTS